MNKWTEGGEKKQQAETAVELGDGQPGPPRLSKCLSKPVISGIVLFSKRSFYSLRGMRRAINSLEMKEGKSEICRVITEPESNPSVRAHFSSTSVSTAV